MSSRWVRYLSRTVIDVDDEMLLRAQRAIEQDEADDHKDIAA